MKYDKSMDNHVEINMTSEAYKQSYDSPNPSFSDNQV